MTSAVVRAHRGPPTTWAHSNSVRSRSAATNLAPLVEVGRAALLEAPIPAAELATVTLNETAQMMGEGEGAGAASLRATADGWSHRGASRWPSCWCACAADVCADRDGVVGRETTGRVRPAAVPRAEVSEEVPPSWREYPRPRVRGACPDLVDGDNQRYHGLQGARGRSAGSDACAWLEPRRSHRAICGALAGTGRLHTPSSCGGSGARRWWHRRRARR